jgi:transposase-like protein
MLKKITVEAALNAEMDEHLGYEKFRKSTICYRLRGIAPFYQQCLT